MTKILGILISDIKDSKCDVEEVEIFDTNNMTVEELREVYSMMFDQDEVIWAIFDISNIESFRNYYPGNQNFVVLPYIKKPYRKIYKDITINFVDLEELINNIKI